MKKLFISLLVIVVILVVIVVAIPFFLPLDTIKKQVAEQAREATGRELAINGDFNVSIFPHVGLKASDVTFSNAEGASDPQMATLKSLLIELEVVPLLSGQVKVDSFVLVEPVIHLEVDKDGKANWDFGAADVTETQSGGSGDSSGAGGSGAMDLEDVTLGDVRLENGLVTYKDAVSGQSLELSNINMTVSMPGLDSPLTADGSLDWNGETLTLKIESDQVRGLMTGAGAAMKVALTSNPVNLSYDGQVKPIPTVQVDGTVNLDVPSVRELAKWAGQPIDAPGDGLGPLKIDGKVKVDDKVYAFNDATIALDQTTGKGAFSADLSGAKPYLNGKLDLDRLDLNAYLPADDGTAASDGGTASGGGGAAPAQSAGWSDEPLDFSGLHAANADFELSVGEILVQALKIGKSALAIALKDGLLQADLTELALYDGTGKGAVTLDGRGEVPAVKKSFSLTGIQAKPLLTDAAGFDRLEGAGEMGIDIAAQGKSQKAMVETLGGKGAIKFADGAIVGINLAAMVRNTASAFLDPGGGTQKTDFTELSGTFTIDKGILTNDDLTMFSPLIRVVGAGTADMPQRTLDYRITPKAVASLEGQGGGDAQGIAVPVNITGPWDNLTYAPDLTAVISNIAKDPNKLIEAGSSGDVGKVLEGLAGGGAASGEGGDSDGESKDTGKDLEDTGKKLIEGLFD